MELRQTMSDWYPSVEQMLQNSGNVPQEVWNMQRSRVVMAIEHLDVNSIAAKMIASLFTMNWHHGCEKLMEELQDEQNAKAGQDGDLFPYDRNILLYWAVIFFQSHTNSAPEQNFNPLVIFQTFCEIPCAWREAFPYYQENANTQGSWQHPELKHPPNCLKYGPLLGYGSLRQLQDRPQTAFDNERHPEDMTLRPKVVSRDTFPMRRLDNAHPYDYAQNILCAILDNNIAQVQQEARCSRLAMQPPIMRAGVPGTADTAQLILRDRAHQSFDDFAPYLKTRTIFYDMRTKPNEEITNVFEFPRNLEDDVLRSTTLFAWYYVTSTGRQPTAEYRINKPQFQPPEHNSTNEDVLPESAVGTSRDARIRFSGVIKRFDIHGYACDNSTTASATSRKRHTFKNVTVKVDPMPSNVSLTD